MLINNFKFNLQLLLKNKLPAFDAHKLMMPEQRLIEFNRIKPDQNTKKSAVLLLFSFKENDFYLTFIKRQKYEGVHSGQIAFPGGKFEKSDKNLINTSLRETEEEIGINTEHIEIIGQLSELFIPPSNFIVSPIVGFSDRALNYKINHREVDVVFEVSISEIINSKPSYHVDFITINNKVVKAPCYIFGQYKVWGATSMILSELIYLLKNYTDLDCE